VQRVAVIGPVAAGKTTLGRALAEHLDVPWIDLDHVYFGGPSIPSDEAWVEQHRALAAGDRWVISGDYRAVARDRFARTDVVVWLDPPRWWCAARAIRRHRRGAGAPLRDALGWIRRYARHGRLETERTLASFPDVRVHRFREPRNVTVDEVTAARST
jgi:adenylate kinase family enzyme